MLKLQKMKHTIKRGLILLFTSLILQTPVLSQTILDSTQTKTLCLILNEHKKLSIENPLLKQQIFSLEELNNLYIKTDSIKNEELSLYKDKVIVDEKTINKLKSDKKKIIFGSSIGGIILLIIGILL